MWDKTISLTMGLIGTQILYTKNSLYPCYCAFSATRLNKIIVHGEMYISFSILVIWLVNVSVECEESCTLNALRNRGGFLLPVAPGYYTLSLEKTKTQMYLNKMLPMYKFFFFLELVPSFFLFSHVQVELQSLFVTFPRWVECYQYVGVQPPCGLASQLTIQKKATKAFCS